MVTRYGLIGFPLSHSFSANYFNEKFASGLFGNCEYLNFEVADPGLVRELALKDPSIAGFNVTIPYKISIIPFLDNLSGEAKEIGAVNLITVKRDAGKIHLTGHNTDHYGFTQSLLPLLEKKGGNALILGTGGSSRSVAYSLGKLGFNYSYVSRIKSENLLSYEDLNGDIIKKTDLIINTTPLGMFPNIDSAPPLDYSLLTTQILFDLVYNPSQTLFMRRGEEKGCKVIGGFKMLILQAEKGWEIWNHNKG